MNNSKLSRVLPAEVGNPFKNFQINHVAKREEEIRRYLQILNRTRAKFDFVTDLAKAVAEHLTLIEEKDNPCSFTTLLRNSRYKALLMCFMTSRSGVDKMNVTDPTAQVVIQTFELEHVNLKQENDRLRLYIRHLEENQQNRISTAKPPGSNSSDADSSAKLILRQSNEMAMVCKSLWLLLEHFKDVVAVDSERGCLVDLTAPARKNVLIHADIAQPFFEWMRKNESIGK